MSEVRCLCGEIATHTAYLPMHDVYAGIRPVTEPHAVCDRHAIKARSMGHLVEEGVTKVPIEQRPYSTRPGPLTEREWDKVEEERIAWDEAEMHAIALPQTLGDWVDLAESIKVRADTSEYADINHKLGIVQGMEEGDTEEAKRWLTRKASELGIR